MKNIGKSPVEDHPGGERIKQEEERQGHGKQEYRLRTLLLLFSGGSRGKSERQQGEKGHQHGQQIETVAQQRLMKPEGEELVRLGKRADPKEACIA